MDKVFNDQWSELGARCEYVTSAVGPIKWVMSLVQLY